MWQLLRIEEEGAFISLIQSNTGKNNEDAQESKSSILEYGDQG